MTRPPRVPGPALAAVALLLALPTAAAHAYLATGEPAPDSHVEAAPAQLRLAFMEELEHEVTHAEVRDLDGTRMDKGQEFPPGEPTVLVVPLRRLPDGVYTVNWVTLSVDTHTARGSYLFAVGNATLEGSPAPSTDHQHPEGMGAVLEASGHAFSFAGVAVAAGLAVFVLFIDRNPSLLARKAAALAAAVGAAGTLLTLLAFAQRVGLPATTLATGTETGGWIASRATLLALAALTLARWPKMGLALAAAALAATSLSSHAAAAATGRPLALATDMAHLAAASVWVGGVAGLLLALPGAGVERAARMVRRFSPWALGSVALLVATGAYASLLHLGAWADLLGTDYGQAILAKILLLFALVGLGALNQKVIGPRLAAGSDRTRALRRSLRAEVILMAAVLAVTGLLTTLAPPDAAAAPPSGPSPAFSKVLQSGHLLVTITPQPVAVGIQTFTVELHPLAAPVPNGTEVYLAFQAPGQGETGPLVPLQHPTPEAWTLRGGYLTSRGAWTVHVIVQNLREYAKPTFQVDVA